MSSFPDVQGQSKDGKREKRRKGMASWCHFLGHTVKNCMTVIGFDGELSKQRTFAVSLWKRLLFILYPATRRKTKCQFLQEQA